MTTKKNHTLALMQLPKGTGRPHWQQEHHDAIHYRRPLDAHENALVSMLRGWAAYADAARAKFDSGIGEDYVLGPEWETIGKGMLGLLNGPTGRLDCGTVDSFIRNSLHAEGFKTD